MTTTRIYAVIVNPAPGPWIGDAPLPHAISATDWHNLCRELRDYAAMLDAPVTDLPTTTDAPEFTLTYDDEWTLTDLLADLAAHGLSNSPMADAAFFLKTAAHNGAGIRIRPWTRDCTIARHPAVAQLRHLSK